MFKAAKAQTSHWRDRQDRVEEIQGSEFPICQKLIDL